MEGVARLGSPPAVVRFAGTYDEASHQFARHRGALQEMGGLRSLANPARPLCLGGISRPLRGTECCPIFGQLGERNAALFFPAFLPGRSPVSNRAIPGMLSEHLNKIRSFASLLILNVASSLMLRMLQRRKTTRVVKRYKTALAK